MSENRNQQPAPRADKSAEREQCTQQALSAPASTLRNGVKLYAKLRFDKVDVDPKFLHEHFVDILVAAGTQNADISKANEGRSAPHLPNGGCMFLWKTSLDPSAQKDFHVDGWGLNRDGSKKPIFSGRLIVDYDKHPKQPKFQRRTYWLPEWNGFYITYYIGEAEPLLALLNRPHGNSTVNEMPHRRTAPVTNIFVILINFSL
jgi:hypothetical protein